MQTSLVRVYNISVLPKTTEKTIGPEELKRLTEFVPVVDYGPDEKPQEVP
jgi:hypothetical protein